MNYLFLSSMVSKVGRICVIFQNVQSEKTRNMFLSIYLSIYLSVCLSVYLSIYLYIYIYIHTHFMLFMCCRRFLAGPVAEAVSNWKAIVADRDPDMYIINSCSLNVKKQYIYIYIVQMNSERMHILYCSVCVCARQVIIQVPVESHPVLQKVVWM